MRTTILASLVGLLFSLMAGCGDDAGDPGDAPPPPVDSGGRDSGGGMDAGGGADSGGGTDAGMAECFDLSGATMDTPFALPGAFTATTPTWMRPDGDDCPTALVSTEAFPFQTACFRNDGATEADFLFEVVGDEDTLPSMLVIYDGDAIPADVSQCTYISPEPIIGNLAETSLTVPAGGEVTLVATLREAGEGGFLFVATPE